MKRLCSIALALALTVALVTGAFAEPKRMGEFEDVRWINGTNLMSKEGRDGYSVVNLEGTAITGEEFDRSFSHYHGLILTRKVDVEGANSMGAVNLEGTEVIPFQYGDIKVISEHWAFAYTFATATADHYDYESWSSDDYYLIDTVDIYNLDKGSRVGSLPRANFEDYSDYGNTINIKDRASGAITAYDADFNVLGTDLDSLYVDDFATPEISTFRSNGQEGLMDAGGNVIMEPSFLSIYSFYGDYAEVSTGDANGLIDSSGNLIIPAEYENIDMGYYSGDSAMYDNFGYFCVVKDGKLGFVRSGGEVSCEPKYAADALKNNGASATYTDIEGKLHILAGDGVETVIEGYDTVLPYNYGKGVLYQVNDADYNYGMIDFHGIVIFPCEYEGISLSGDGRYALVDVDYDVSELYELDYSAIGGGAEDAGAAPAVIAPVAEVESETAEEAAAPEAAEEAAAPVVEEPAAPEAAQEPAAPEAAEEAPAPEAAEEVPAEAESATAGAAASYLDSAILLLNADAAGNGAAAASLLSAALAEIGADSPAGGMISSAITLLEADPGANGAAAITLLESAKGLM